MLKQKHGLTLIEVTLVLAITGLLLLLVFMGQSQTRARQQFTAEIEAVLNRVNITKNEANSTVHSGPGTGGAANDQVFFAKTMEFTSGSSAVSIRTLIDDGTNTLQAAETTTYNLAGNLVFGQSALNPGQAIVFVRNAQTGKLQVYTFVWGATDAQIRDKANYSQPPASITRNFLLTDQASGLRGELTVNPDVIGRRYL